MNADVALTDDEREALGFQTPGSGGILAERVEAIVAAREAAARDAGARRVLDAVDAELDQIGMHHSRFPTLADIDARVRCAARAAVSDLRTEPAPDAEVERLRAERDEARENSRQMVSDRNICHKAELAWMRRAKRAEAALEKVRALADRADARADASTRLVTTAALRAAIGGHPMSAETLRRAREAGMTAPLEAIAARVLAEHAPWRNQIGIVKRCRCGEVMDGIKRHRAHVAAALTAAIRADEGLVEAMAEAYRRAASKRETETFGRYDTRRARVALDAITGLIGGEQ